MNFFVGFGCLVAVAVTAGASGLPEQQLTIENQIADFDMSKEEADRSEIAVPSCEDIGGTCMSKKHIKKNKCKGKLDYKFSCPKTTRCCIESCPVSKDFFWTPHPYNQCFKLLVTPVESWYAAQQACENAGLVLAKPLETISLRNYLVLRYGGPGVAVQAWLDAVADGQCVKWNRGPYECISPDIPLWWPNQPRVAVGNCLVLTSNPENWGEEPDKTLYSQSCLYTGRYALCELLM